MLKSFIDYNKDNHFPIQNIPFGVGLLKDEERPCTRIGDYVIDLKHLEDLEIFEKTSLGQKKVFQKNKLNDFMAAGHQIWKEVREIIQVLFNEQESQYFSREILTNMLTPANKVKMLMPVNIGDYTDFYSSREHASNVGEMFRGKENALMPNWLHIPIAYHGRSSSIIISGQDIKRPKGQIRPNPEQPPIYDYTRQLDFELEMGFFIGQGNELGEPVKASEAKEKIFGLVIVNDWSARDIQAWEYQPLGPFLAKNFATSISPWIITLDALEPFKTNGPEFENDLLPYLKTEGNPTYDINLEVKLKSGKMTEPVTICKSNYKYLYYNMFQHLAHHTVNGCNMRTGDLLASGTISGKEKNERGSMLEITWRGNDPLKLPDNSERKFIENDDEVIISASASNKDFTIGFGQVTGKIII